jgi:hypothetical protein
MQNTQEITVNNPDSNTVPITENLAEEVRYSSDESSDDSDKESESDRDTNNKPTGCSSWHLAAAPPQK